eukprot:2703797-Pyramimonas_sp.AAC.1
MRLCPWTVYRSIQTPAFGCHTKGSHEASVSLVWPRRPPCRGGVASAMRNYAHPNAEWDAREEM